MIPAVRYGIPQTLGGVWAVSRPTHSVAGSLFGKVIAGSSRFLHKKKPLVKVTFPEGFEIADGTHVDLGDTVELKNGDFMRVRKYEKHTKGSAYRKHVVSGWLFRRVNKTVGLSREYHNEVYQVDYLGGLSTHLSPEDRGIQYTSLSKVLRKRDLMLVTSPDRVSEKGGRGKSETAKCLDILFCQWRQQFRTKRAIKDKPGDAFNLKEGSPAEAAYLPLRPGGCEQRRINDIDKENLSREKQESEVSRGNCKDPVSPRSSECEPLFSAPEGFESLSLEDENKDGRLKSTSSDSPMPEYTFLDFFFGAGGASCGARAAGLKVLGGFDHDANPCETYRLNFPYADGRQMDAQDHGSIRNGEWKADIVHFSPPCQAFSKANTSPNAQKDKINVAANNLVGVWLDKIVPRIATVEQTDGLLVRRRHRKHLDSMIQSFTSRGFSIRLDLLNLADFGVPQPRKRLIILAARAGESLPECPKPTHSARPEKTGLKEYVTVNETIDNIPVGCPNHDIRKTFKAPKVPSHWFRDKGNGLLPNTITTKSNSYHPSLSRTMTLRENASLQTFRLDYKFSEQGVKKQIGNAVPPRFATVLFTSIKEHLLRQDGFMI